MTTNEIVDIDELQRLFAELDPDDLPALGRLQDALYERGPAMIAEVRRLRERVRELEDTIAGAARGGGG